MLECVTSNMFLSNSTFVSLNLLRKLILSSINYAYSSDIMHYKLRYSNLALKTGATRLCQLHIPSSFFSTWCLDGRVTALEGQKLINPGLTILEPRAEESLSGVT